jgi:hypothetical protein
MWETDHCQLHALPEAFIEVFFLYGKIFTLSRFGARLRNNTGVLLSFKRRRTSIFYQANKRTVLKKFRTKSPLLS